MCAIGSRTITESGEAVHCGQKFIVTDVFLADEVVAFRGALLTQSHVTTVCFRTAKDKHLTANMDDAEQCAYRLRCMMSQFKTD